MGERAKRRNQVSYPVHAISNSDGLAAKNIFVTHQSNHDYAFVHFLLFLLFLFI